MRLSKLNARYETSFVFLFTGNSCLIIQTNEPLFRIKFCRISSSKSDENLVVDIILFSTRNYLPKFIFLLFRKYKNQVSHCSTGKSFWDEVQFHENEMRIEGAVLLNFRPVSLQFKLAKNLSPTVSKLHGTPLTPIFFLFFFVVKFVDPTFN